MSEFQAWNASIIFDFFSDFGVQGFCDAADIMVVFTLLSNIHIFQSNDELCYYKWNTM